MKEGRTKYKGRNNINEGEEEKGRKGKEGREEKGRNGTERKGRERRK